MGFYTINDLRDKLYTYPCSSEKNYISYTNGRLIEIIKRDFDGEKLFEEKKSGTMKFQWFGELQIHLILRKQKLLLNQKNREGEEGN